MKISNFNLAIGIPLSFPWVPSSFFDSFVMMKKPEFTFLRASNGGVDAMRNDIVEKAISVGASHLIMMDADMVYHPDTIPRLLSRKLPIVGALCFRRYPPFDSIMLKVKDMGAVRGYESIQEWDEDELVEVDATGAGCLMFEMEIFRRMPKPWFKFYQDPETGGVIGEDIGFCQDLKAAGYRIFVDTSVPSGHLTTMIVSRETNKLYRHHKARQIEALARCGLGVEREQAAA